MTDRVERNSQYRAVVIGATGAVGSLLVRELLASPRCDGVTALVRRPVDAGGFGDHRGVLRLRVIDLEKLEDETAAAARGCHVAFCTMGIGQPRKRPPDEVRRVDIDYAVAFARGARAAGIGHLSLLTSVEANPHSRAWYLRFKGEAEQRVAAAGIPRTSFFRPSMLITREIRYGWQDRVTRTFLPLVSWALPSRFHAIRVEDLARAMRINAERPGTGVEVLHYSEYLALLASERKEASF